MEYGAFSYLEIPTFQFFFSLRRAITGKGSHGWLLDRDGHLISSPVCILGARSNGRAAQGKWDLEDAIYLLLRSNCYAEYLFNFLNTFACLLLGVLDYMDGFLA
jgi:hypothetical protein